MAGRVGGQGLIESPMREELPPQQSLEKGVGFAKP